MASEVFLITTEDEVCIGTVGQVLDDGDQNYKLERSIRDVVDRLVFDDNSKDYAVITLEIR